MLKNWVDWLDWVATCLPLIDRDAGIHNKEDDDDEKFHCSVVSMVVIGEIGDK